MSEYTKGELAYSMDGDRPVTLYIVEDQHEEKGLDIAHLDQWSSRHNPEQKANAQRLCACWNACKDMEEPEKVINEMRAQLFTVERLALQGGAGHDAIVSKAVELKRQRDALLEACEMLLNNYEALGGTCGVGAAKAAISLAKGGV